MIKLMIPRNQTENYNIKKNAFNGKKSQLDMFIVYITRQVCE